MPNTAAAPAAKPAPTILALTQAALAGASPDEAALEQTTDPADAKREDAGEDADFSDLHVSAGGDDADDLDIQDDDSSEEEEVDASAEAGDGEAVDDASNESTDSDSESEVDAPATGKKQRVTITDDEGRREVEVDFSDIPYMTKVVQQAAGARKLLGQVKNLKSELEEARKGVEPVAADAADFKRLAGAWDKDGLGGLVRELTQGKQTLDQVVDAEVARRAQLKAMTPAERAAHDEAQGAKRDAAEIKKQKDELQAALDKLNAKEESAEKATFQNYMESGLAKHGFEGKLGDEARETRLNKMLWNAVRSEIAEMPDDAVIDGRLVQRLFSEQVRALQVTVKEQVREGTKKVLATKKVEAKEQAQTQMRAATRAPSVETELRKQIASGNFVGGIVAALSGKRKK